MESAVDKVSKRIEAGEEPVLVATSGTAMAIGSLISNKENHIQSKLQGYKINVFSDSKYVVSAVNENWLFEWEKNNYKKKKNKDLWIRFLHIYRKHTIKLTWIKGHSGHPQNEKCDKLAVNASNLPSLKKDIGYENNLNSPKTLFD